VRKRISKTPIFYFDILFLIGELSALINPLNLQDYHAILIGGDFNLHHPLWNPVNYTKHDPHADTLVDFMTEKSLQPLLPPGTITFPLENQSGGTAIDLV
jgi:Endonuclease-reverse transcriptase